MDRQDIYRAIRSLKATAQQEFADVRSVADLARLVPERAERWREIDQTYRRLKLSVATSP
jgi:hypothetical protein